ncbi:MAG TPA: hypothetical protein VMS08_03500 [Candidatus Saccharimonadia bacterium]|nr:hypothetical protein [Candidatus Saccharimonadia bacterium]
MKFGRKPFRPTPRTQVSGAVMRAVLKELGEPPLYSEDYVSAVNVQSPSGWGVLGNENFGCCVQADDGHYLMLRTANAGKIIIPTTEQVLALYSYETGFNPDDPASDQGTDEGSDCEYLVSNGFLGHKADATGFIDPQFITDLKWCIELFGGCKFGINIPQSALDQFNAGEPWTVVTNDANIIGGHDVLGVRYDGVWFYVVTWGEIQRVEPNWILKYAEEAHVLLFADWIKTNGSAPSGFDLKALIAALPQIESSTQPSDAMRRHRHHRRVMKRRRRSV